MKTVLFLLPGRNRVCGMEVETKRGFVMVRHTYKDQMNAGERNRLMRSRASWKLIEMTRTACDLSYTAAGITVGHWRRCTLIVKLINYCKLFLPNVNMYIRTTKIYFEQMPNAPHKESRYAANLSPGIPSSVATRGYFTNGRKCSGIKSMNIGPSDGLRQTRRN